MEEAVSTARRTGVVIVALVSLAAGLALIWLLVDPRVIGRVTTAHMLIMLGLFLLPAATFCAWHYERSNRPAEESAEDECESEAGTAVSAPASTDDRASIIEFIQLPTTPATPIGRSMATASRAARIDTSPARRPVEPARHRRASDVGAGR